MFNFNLNENYNYNLIYLTFNLKNSLLIEPSFGFLLESQHFHAEYQLGLGVFAKKPVADNFHIMYGMRFAASKNTSSIAPAIGGEYFLMSNFSLASEVQLRFLSDSVYWYASTTTSVIVRFYFK